MMKKILAVAVTGALLAGCSMYSINSQDIGKTYYPSKKSIDDVAYLEKVDQPYEEIGIVTVTTERRQALEDVIPKMKYEAAILGGDAITDIKTDATGTWKLIQPKKLLGNAYVRANFSAQVIVFTGKPATTAPAAGN